MDKSEIYTKLNEAYFSDNCHEMGIIRHLPELLTDAKLFVDLGASLGQYTYYANQIMTGGRIIALEADPVRYEELARNCQRWQVEGSNQIEAVHAAAAQADGQIDFYVTGTNFSGGLFPREREDAESQLSWQQIRVPARSLDSLLNGRVPDLVKIDVEGGEFDVLSGAQGLLALHRVPLLLELHPGTLADGRDIATATRQLLTRARYEEKPFYERSLFVPKQPWSLLRRLACRCLRWR